MPLVAVLSAGLPRSKRSAGDSELGDCIQVLSYAGAVLFIAKQFLVGLDDVLRLGGIFLKQFDPEMPDSS
jgi:hypothetical protein